MTFALTGPAYCITGDVDTDTVIKSRHCVSLRPEDLGPHCLAELAQEPRFEPGYPIILCAGTFGIGSARREAHEQHTAATIRQPDLVIGLFLLRACPNNPFSCGRQRQTPLPRRNRVGPASDSALLGSRFLRGRGRSGWRCRSRVRLRRRHHRAFLAGSQIHGSSADRGDARRREEIHPRAAL